MQGSGKSSLNIWTAWDTMSTAATRVLDFVLNVSWRRNQDETAGFATVGTSLVGSTDIVQGQNSIIAKPDVFSYMDETDRVKSVEYDRQLIEPLGGLSMALMDIVLDNHDNRFTPQQNATIGTAILPNRPINSHIGFVVNSQNKTVPIFKGLTRTPRERRSTRDVSVNCIDYVKFLNEYPLESAIYTDQRSDQIIEDILTDVGFGSSQYELDTGLNTIGFAWFKKGDTAGERIKKICEAEEAIFYQDEAGVLRFENRRKYSQSPYGSSVWKIDPSDIILWEEDNRTEVINRVIVTAKPREVQSTTEIWRDGFEEEIPVGETLTIWAEWDAPATSIITPVATTDYTAYSGSGGTGSNLTSDLSITIDKFTQTAKIQITNNSTSKVYVNYFRLRGTPATITGEVLQIAENSDSIAKYDEQQLEIENDFIDNTSFARYLAGAIVTKYSEPARRIILMVQGLPHIQLRDKVTVDDQDLDTTKDYRVMRVQGELNGGVFTQKLYLREVTDKEADAWAIVGVATVSNDNEFVGI